MSPNVHILPDADAVCQAAADLFRDHSAHAIAAKGFFTVALSGGSTPRRLYQVLAKDPYRSNIDWQRIHFFWGDERCVPPDHADSNYGMAWKELLAGLRLPAGNVHRMQAEREDRDVAARDYQIDIADVFDTWPNEPPPALDLVFLGMGPDGHTASLFPGTEALKHSVCWVLPNLVPKFNAFRLTLTPFFLNRAQNVVFLVAGADKAGVLREVLQGPLDPQRLPSQLIQPASGNLFWLIDEAAGRELKQ